MIFMTITLAISSLLLAFCAFLSWRLGKRLLEAITRLHLATQDMIRAMDDKTLLKTLDRELKKTGRGFRGSHGERIFTREEVEKAGGAEVLNDR